ncbi:hypothetical protein B0H13DRAFT_1852366 [Mycena leptocephala]|nr:hypothetical protein B0H13DRAFT_1852366 [Mycena leptocephala]
MSAINGSVPTPTTDSIASLPPITRTDTSASIATTVEWSRGQPVDASVGEIDLPGFSGDTPAPVPVTAPSQPPPAATAVPPPSTVAPRPASKGKARERNASPGPSTPSLPAAAQAAAKEFIANIDPQEIPPSDKRYDGKTETRAFYRPFHSLTQNTAQLFAEVRGNKEDAVNESENILDEIACNSLVASHIWPEYDSEGSKKCPCEVSFNSSCS